MIFKEAKEITRQEALQMASRQSYGYPIPKLIKEENTNEKRGELANNGEE